MTQLNGAVGELTDSAALKKDYVKAQILDRIVALRTMYTAVPFEAEKVKQAAHEIANYRERALPALKEIIADEKEDRHIRTLAISLLGETGNKAASDVLLEVLSGAADPDFKVEAIIAVGKMHETRAIYLIQQLANDPDDAVAFTAQEVLHQFQTQQGITLPNNLKFRKVTIPDTLYGRSASIGLKSSRPLHHDSTTTGKIKTGMKPAGKDSLRSVPPAGADTGKHGVPAASPIDSLKAARADTTAAATPPDSVAGKVTGTAVSNTAADTIRASASGNDQKADAKSKKKGQKKPADDKAPPEEGKNW
jgi:hypothetical protein